MKYKQLHEGLIEGPFLDGKIRPRLEDGSVPSILYRIMSVEEFEAGMNRGFFLPRPRIHASSEPLYDYCEPGDQNVLISIDYSDDDGWQAKVGGDIIVAVTDQPIEDEKVRAVAFGTRHDIERAVLSEDVQMDNVKGWGAVPLNQDVDYHGLRTLMSPSIYLELTPPFPYKEVEMEKFKYHLSNGGQFAAPFLDIKVPAEWDDDDFEDHAQVVGHEDRHRMQAIFEIFGDDPVEIHLFFHGGLRNRDITGTWILALTEGLMSQTKELIEGPLFTLL